jgi:hypothetical protein
VTTSGIGEVAPGRRKRINIVSWSDVNFTMPKIKKIHTIDSIATIGL